jgi:uncharacterized membrane protein
MQTTIHMNNQLIKTMGISSAMSVMLVFLRMQWSGNLLYVFLVWNLFLAWVPFLFALALTDLCKRTNSKWQLAGLFFGWLAFFPNSPYMLTDLFHLHLRSEVPLWFDLILILSFAWNGLLLGYASLFEIQQFLKSRISARLMNLFIGTLMMLCSFGIYLGRYPRYNSWDIIAHPIILFSDIFNMLLHPFQNTRMVGVTFFFSVFLIISYWTLNVLINHKKHES